MQVKSLDNAIKSLIIWEKFLMWLNCGEERGGGEGNTFSVDVDPVALAES